MNNEDIQSKLTPAAREAVLELVENYRRQILFGAMRSASSYVGGVEEISVRDVITSVRSIDRSSRDRRRPYVDRVYRATMILGLLYAIVGFGYFLMQSTEVSLDTGQTIGLATGLSGTVVSLGSYFYLRRRAEEHALHQEVISGEPFTRQRVQEYDASMSVIEAWGRIELAMRAFVASAYGESTARQPVSVLIAQVEATDALTQDDQRMLRHLLNIRNGVVHKGRVPDATQLRTALRDADRIVAKLDPTARPAPSLGERPLA